MTKISLRGKITILIYFFVMTLLCLYFGEQGKIIIGAIFLALDFLGGILLLQLISFLNKVEEDNKKFEEEHKDEKIIKLSFKELRQLKKNGFIIKDGERIENGD